MAIQGMRIHGDDGDSVISDSEAAIADVAGGLRAFVSGFQDPRILAKNLIPGVPGELDELGIHVFNVTFEKRGAVGQGADPVVTQGAADRALRFLPLRDDSTLRDP